ncbi:MAG: sigma-70 family RNA polymerase sigma factor [Deltaproteobacteria bacterium]|nr:sigma-70 family RNA polymerase sigma factor [Deltaproteobacteria bacterium]
MIFNRPGRKRPTDEDAARAAFNEEALVHMDSIFNAARYMTRDAAAAEDLVQETFLRAFRFWDRYKPGTNCKAWLFRILTNTFINKNRKRQRTYSLIEDADTDAGIDGPLESSAFYSTPEQEYLSQLFPEHVRAAVEALPDNFRIPVILADLHDFSYKEIAEMMDCPVGTVMSRLFRGRKQLQEELFGYALELGIISPASARDEDGTISLETYRARKKSAAAG